MNNTENTTNMFYLVQEIRAQIARETYPGNRKFRGSEITESGARIYWYEFDAILGRQIRAGFLEIRKTKTGQILARLFREFTDYPGKTWRCPRAIVRTPDRAGIREIADYARTCPV